MLHPKSAPVSIEGEIRACLMNRLDNPVDARITTYSFVLRVDKDNLEVFIGGVLVDPIRVEDPQISATTSNTFFGGGFERTLVFQLVDTLVGRFAFWVG